MTLNQNKMKQTAVEWLVEQVFMGNTNQWQLEIDQALEMEKEQMKSSYNDGKRAAYKQDDVPTAEGYVYQKYGV